MKISSIPPALVAVLLATPLAAQEPARDTTRLQPLVITATRVPLAQTAPVAAATVITGEDLRALGIASIADALRLVPGAAVSPSGSFGGTTSLFLRGGERDYVRVLVDGIPVNQPGGEIDLAHLTTDNVERIEIVRGPASVLYGSDAVSGVVQIFTRRGGEERSVTADMKAGSYGTREGSLTAAGGSTRSAWSGGVGMRRANGIYDFNNEYRNDVVSGSLSLTPDERTDLRISGRLGDARFNYPTDGTGEPVDVNAFRTERQFMVTMDAGRRISRLLETRILLGATDADLRNDDRPDQPGDGGYVSRNEVARQSVDGRVMLHLAPAAIVVTGLEYTAQRDRNESVSWFGGDVSPAPQQTPRRFNRAGYLQSAGDLGNRVSYSAGLRHDANANFGNFLTYRLASGVRIGAATFVRASAGTAFKEPTILENYGGGFVVGNPELDPERSRSWEVGLEQRLPKGIVTLAATWFDQRFRDKIEFIFVDGVATYANLSAARARGIELEARTRPHPAVTISGSYTVLSTRVEGESGTLGQRLLRRPRTLAVMAADYRAGARGTLGVVLNAVGRRADLDFTVWPSAEVELPSYERVDVHGELVVWRAPAGGRTLSITSRAENILDTEYESVYGFRTPGRTLLAGARMSLGW